MKDKYVGTIVGNYRILERMPDRDKYGHNILYDKQTELVLWLNITV